MRLANLSGRAVLVSSDGGRALDVERASDGRLPSSLAATYERFEEVRAFAAGRSLDDATPFGRAELGPPSPTPRQIFAIGLNYRDHASETGSTLPTDPLVFTKFVSSLAAPDARVAHPGGDLDWEVELVVVIGRGGRNVSVDDAWDHVAGVTVGQDFSERVLQHAGRPPQFSLGKSYEGFGPIGPVLVTPDELASRDDLRLGCLVNGEVVQEARTSQMVFSVPELVARLSEVVELYPGDVVFTGTPAGVGMGHVPPRFLSVGDELTSYIEGIGEIHNAIVEGKAS